MHFGMDGVTTENFEHQIGEVAVPEEVMAVIDQTKEQEKDDIIIFKAIQTVIAILPFVAAMAVEHNH